MHSCIAISHSETRFFASWFRSTGLGTAISIIAFTVGCSTIPTSPEAVGPAYKPNNIHCVYPILPETIRRVAVLPISFDPNDRQAAKGGSELQSSVFTELSKVKKFEILAVSSEQLRDWSGRASWNSDEELPSGLLIELKSRLNCDAVLFTHLRPFHAYKPLTIGWNLKLVDCQSALIFWSADEVFDSSNAMVSRAAQRYAQEHGESWWSSTSDPTSILNSPRRFSRYTLSALFSSLPDR